MHPDIYRQYQNRRVDAPDGYVDDLLDSIRQLSVTCQQNVLMLEEELVINDPYLSERCGLLDDRFEVFAMTIPKCRGYMFAVSIDLKEKSPPPAMMHGVISSTGKCDTAKRLTMRHRKLVNPTWET